MEEYLVTVLKQEEADTLRMIEKYLINPQSVKLPPAQETTIYDIYYMKDDKRYDNMNLSTYRGRKNPHKVSYRILYDKCVMLVRIDSQDATYHINPDGKTKILPYQPHIHIYKEGYGDKYAYLLPDEFSKTDDIVTLFMEFLSYSHVINADKISMIRQEVLFDGY